MSENLISKYIICRAWGIISTDKNIYNLRKNPIVIFPSTVLKTNE